MTDQNDLARTLDTYASSWGPLTSDDRMTAFTACLHADRAFLN